MLPALRLRRVPGLGEGRILKAKITIGHVDRTTFFQNQEIFVLQKGYVLPEMLKEPPCVILDLGAHNGIATIQFVAYFPEAFIHCYEPDPGNFKVLKLNTSDLPQVKIHGEAVGPKSGEATLYVNLFRRGASSLKPRKVARMAIACRVRSLDDILKSIRGVDMIKFDIEGVEREVFAYSKLVHGVKHIVGEIKASPEQARDFLRLSPLHKGYLFPLAE